MENLVFNKWSREKLAGYTFIRIGSSEKRLQALLNRFN